MPVAVSFGDDFALHEDAEDWEYQRAGDYGPYIAVLVDEDGEPTGADVVVSNAAQLSQLTIEEYRELIQEL